VPASVDGISSSPNCLDLAALSSSLLMSMRQPVNGSEPDVLTLLADRQRQLLVLDDHFHDALAVVDDRHPLHLGRAGALVTKAIGSSENSTMSIFSPRSSRMIDWTRVPFIPTQAPTGSTSRSREKTATLARSPASRTAPRITTVPS
jgi:hypothetical protein